MQSDAARAAFTLSVVQQRRDAQRVTSLALLAGGGRVFLGLDSGVLEEHAWQPHGASGGAPALRLVAEKRAFSRAAVAEVAPAEATGRLVCMSDDGQVVLVSLETFAVAPLPAVRGAVALAVQAPQRLPALAAVAVRQGKARSRVLVFAVLPSCSVAGGQQPALLVDQVQVEAAVSGLAWAGSSLLLAVPGGYMAMAPVSPAVPPRPGGGGAPRYRLAVVADHLQGVQPLVASLPELGLGLLLWEEGMVLVTDPTGAAVREPLQLPSQPLALAAAGLFVVAVCDDGVHVFDRSTSREVQHLPYYHDDAHIRLTQRLPAAADAAGRRICLAASGQVLQLEPIAVERQVRELLKRKRFSQALDLIASTPQAARQPADGEPGAAPAPEGGPPTAPSPPLPLPGQQRAPGGAPWQQVALAQAGLLMLLECGFDEGLGVLEGLPADVWEPCQIFGLFPAVTSRWLPRVPARAYWGIHGQQLPELAQLVADALELRAATAPAGHQQQQQQQHQQQPWSHGSSSGGGGSSGGLALLAGGGAEGDAAALVWRGKAAVAGYLGRVRGRPGALALPDGVDALLLQLLCDVGDAAAAEALAGGLHAAAAGSAAAALRLAGRWHAFALLHMHTGSPEEALSTWKALAAGELHEAPSSSGAVAAAGGDAAAVAVAAAASAMAAGPAVVPLALLVGGGCLAWLLEHDASATLAVLEAREDLEPREVLEMLQGAAAGDLRWQYLYHLVHYSSHCGSAQLHTQLATVLLEALAALIAPTDSTAGEGGVGGSSSGGGSSKVTAGELAAMARQLPVCFSPNAAPGTAAVAPGPPQAHQRGLAGPVASACGFGGSSAPSRAASAGSTLAWPGLLAPSRSRSTLVPCGGVPSAMSLAASLAGLSRRNSREAQQARPPHSAAGAAQQPQHPSPHQALALNAQHHRRRQRQSLGALAGEPVALWQPGSALSRQGTALSGLFAPPSSSGFGAPSLGPAALDALSRPLSSKGAATQQWQQQQQQPWGAEFAERAAVGAPAPLRALPGGLGPWPIEAPGGGGDGAPDANAGGDPAEAAADAEAAAAGGAAFSRVLLLRCLLTYHIQASLLYDAQAVLAAARTLPLHVEQALLHSRAGAHSAALALLALAPPRLVEGAISYCRALGSQEAWLALLDMFLNPRGSPEAAAAASAIAGAAAVGPAAEAPGLEPDWASAARVLNAEGASLNPQRLLAALPPGMPLHVAGGLLGQLLGGLQHRRRHGQVVRHLQRCQHLSGQAELVDLQRARVLLTDDTPCGGCGRLIGSRVFWRFPSGVVVCSRCSGPAAAEGAAAALPAASPVPSLVGGGAAAHGTAEAAGGEHATPFAAGGW